MATYEPGDFVWSCYDGEWYEAEVEEIEAEGTYRVYYHEYDDSVPGQPLHLIKDWQEGETEPPPDGPNQAQGELEESYDEEEVPETEEVNNIVEDDGAARLAKKKAEMEKAQKEKKLADSKAKAEQRASTKPKESKQYEAAQQAERRKSQKREELESQHNFTPQLATRRASGSQVKSSNRTSALYEHGKSKQQALIHAQSEGDVKTPAKKSGKAPKANEERINRLYQAGKEREMARLQKEDAEKEIQHRSSTSVSYDARLGFDKSHTGLGQDLVTTGARTNALYQEAQMRAQKKKQLREEEEKKAKQGSFKPKLFTKGAKTSKSDVASRLYQDGVNKAKKLQQKRDQSEYDDSATFQPDISLSQRNCESSSLPGARHEALFMQGEVQRMRREEMYENFVDGKEVDDLTFTPAVNYRYNDELLAHDTSDFTERLYRTDFAGSKQREEENWEYMDHQYDECTFEPEMWTPRKEDDESGSARIDKLYSDAEKIKKKKEEKLEELERQNSSRKLKLTARKNDDDDDYGPKAHERLYASHKKKLEENEKKSKEPVKSSFRPKLFTSKKSRDASQRQTEDLYKQGVAKVAAIREAEKTKLPHHLAAAEEEAAKHSFTPQLATRKKKKDRNSLGDASMNPMMRMDSGDSVASDMSDLSINSYGSSASIKSKGSATGLLAAKKTKASTVRSERSAALQSKAAELLAKRQAAKSRRAMQEIEVESVEVEETF